MSQRAELSHVRRHSRSSPHRKHRHPSCKTSSVETWKDYPELQNLIKNGLVNKAHLEIVTRDPADLVTAYNEGRAPTLLPSGITVEEYDTLYDVLEACKELKCKGLTDSQFYRLTIKKYAKHVCENNECCICFKDFRVGERLIVLPCESQHGFHKDCIKPWFDYSRTCPICRGSCVIAHPDGSGGEMRFKRSMRVRAVIEAMQQQQPKRKPKK